ncbi:MAG: Ku protein [Parvibaculaceae bacterium]
MPAKRAYWSGQLRLSLVSIPIDIFPATTSASRLSFRQIHKPTGKPIQYEKTVAGAGPVDRDEIIKGYEVDKGNYVLLTEEELDAVKLESRKTLELSQFVDACEIDPIYFERPYYVVPSDELAEDAYRVIRDALRSTKKVGLGQLAMRGRENVVAVKPSGNGLVLETLRYEDEIRKADPYFREIGKGKSNEDLLAVAKQLIDKKTAPFDAGAFKDHYGKALKELVERKLKSKGRKITVEKEEKRPTGDNVIDLMSALKKSLGKSGAKPSAKSRPARKTRARKRKSA